MVETMLAKEPELPVYVDGGLDGIAVDDRVGIVEVPVGVVSLNRDKNSSYLRQPRLRVLLARQMMWAKSLLLQQTGAILQRTMLVQHLL